ncbi:MAG TPA: hypothetical protein VIV11_16195 [Kofleriaceae bacterium]
MRAVLLGLVLVIGCSADEDSFGGERLSDGFIRYKADSVRLQPGETKQFVQWVSAPLDRDMDVISVRGSQGPGGHHALLYASPDVEPVGTNRAWTSADQITSRFLGGAGGEGASAATQLPPGAVLRVPAGSGFYIQSHYLNVGDEPIETGSTVDVMLAEPSPEFTVLSMFVSGTLAVSVPPGASEQTLICDVVEDTQLVLYFNHIHETGVSVATELRSGDGAVQMVKHDPAWDYEWSTAPNFRLETLEQPLVLTAGQQLVTTCNWNNLTDKTLRFPDEMCAFLGFYIGNNDRACANGEWINL